jgi:hypothetical protein
MRGSIHVTYLGPQPELAVNVAGGFKFVLRKGVRTLMPEWSASMFTGPEFVVEDTGPETPITASEPDALLEV